MPGAYTGIPGSVTLPAPAGVSTAMIRSQSVTLAFTADLEFIRDIHDVSPFKGSATNPSWKEKIVGDVDFRATVQGWCDRDVNLVLEDYNFLNPSPASCTFQLRAGQTFTGSCFLTNVRVSTARSQPVTWTATLEGSGAQTAAG